MLTNGFGVLWFKESVISGKMSEKRRFNMAKFREIKRFTISRGYRVSVSWDDLVDHLARYQDMGLQMNPDFQRGHVWTERQQVAYVEYALRCGVGGREIFFNHPDWLGDSKRGGDFVLVDGLQRLTSILKFLNNDLPVFGGNFYRDYTDSLSWVDHVFYFNVNNLKTREEVLTWYLEMNSGGVVHSEEELERVRLLKKK